MEKQWTTLRIPTKTSGSNKGGEGKGLAQGRHPGGVCKTCTRLSKIFSFEGGPGRKMKRYKRKHAAVGIGRVIIGAREVRGQQTKGSCVNAHGLGKRRKETVKKRGEDRTHMGAGSAGGTW